MKKLLLLLALAPCFAQTMSMSCPASVKAGATLTVPITLAGSGGGLTAFQFTASTTPQIGPLTATVTGTAAAANKGIFTSPGGSILIGGIGPPPPTATLNATPIANGTVATLNWAVPATLPASTIQITLAGGAIPLMGTGASAGFGGIAPGPPCTVAVTGSTTPNLCDLDGNGTVDQADVTAQVNRVFAVPQPANCARDASGCNAVPVQIVINATGINGTSGKCTADR